MIGIKHRLFRFFVGRDNTTQDEPWGAWFMWRPRPWEAEPLEKIPSSLFVSAGFSPKPYLRVERDDA